MEPELIVRHLLLVVVLVAGMDLGIAALIRAARESGRSDHDRD